MIATLVASPAHGTLTFNTDGSFSYTPNLNFFGSDSFTYKANDGLAYSNVATVSLTITPVNDAPVAANDAYTTNEDAPLTVEALAGPLGNDTDVEGDPLTVVLVDGPTHGTLSLNPDGGFTYTPAPNFNGSDSFNYKANDGSLDSNVATVTITIATPGNQAPVAVNDAAGTLMSMPVVVSVLANDTDADGDLPSIYSFTQAAHGQVSDNGDGTLLYTPSLTFVGSDSFNYTVIDGNGGSSQARVDLGVMPSELVISAGAQANDGGPDTYRLIKKGEGIEVTVNGNIAFSTPFAIAPLLKFTGSKDVDTFIVDFSAGNPIFAMGVSFDGRSGKEADSLSLTAVLLLRLPIPSQVRPPAR